MPLTIHNIHPEIQKDENTGAEIKTLRCNFYMPFFREGAAFGLAVDEFPDPELHEGILREALMTQVKGNEELRALVQNAITEEKHYLEGQIKHHDDQKQVCLDRLKELETVF